MVQDCSGKKTEKISYEHCLDTYDTRDKLIIAFENLAKHYFRFKRYEQGKRKDLCEDRVLFKFADKRVYKLDRLMTDEKQPRDIAALRHRIEQYRVTHFDEKIRKACDTLLDQLQREALSQSCPSYQRGEAELLQQLIARRMSMPYESLSESIETIKALLQVSEDIF